MWVKRQLMLCLSLLLLGWNGGIAAAAGSTLPVDQPQPVEEELPAPPQEESPIPEEDPAPEESPTLEESPALEESPPPEETPPAEQPEQSGEEENESIAYLETLGDCRIENGVTLSYTTISSAFAGSGVVEGFYPGDLTISVTGQVVVEAGGVLSIGTLSVGGTEASPVISRAGDKNSQIVVKAGGQLRLIGAVLDMEGQGPLIVQEPGGSVELVATQAEEGVIQWSLPLVNNLYDNPDDIWLEEGTLLTKEMLPDSLQTTLQIRGQEQWTALPLEWDLSGYGGQTEGELTLTGRFLDETGQVLLSLVPLELAVHWYSPETLTVTGAVWKGDLLPTVQLTVQELPEYADVWGEVSEDNGETWVRWEDEEEFFIVDMEPEGKACVFVLPDDTPRLFRIAAEDPWEHRYWRSEAFDLRPQESDDSGGNRGGSTTPDAPQRVPQPPDPTETPQESPAPEEVPPLEESIIPDGETTAEEITEGAEEANSGALEKPGTGGEEAVPLVEVIPKPDQAENPPNQSLPDQEPVQALKEEPPQETQPAASETPAEEQVDSDEPVQNDLPAVQARKATPETERTETSSIPGLSPAVQVALVIAGGAACVVAGMALTGAGPFRRKKSE